MTSVSLDRVTTTSPVLIPTRLWIGLPPSAIIFAEHRFSSSWMRNAA